MRKFFTLLLCTSFLFFASGCSLGDLVDKFVSAGDSAAEEPVPDKPRVYMDEVHGILQDFTGNKLTVLASQDTFIFDVSQATLECEDGMITGDEISVIYEGQLNLTDTSTVKALKVVDEYHKKNKLEDQVISGVLRDLTPNTITIKDSSGISTTYPITGCEQFYQNGIRTGATVYLHYKGKITADSAENNLLQGTHLKVLTISDVEPFITPSATQAPISEETENEVKQFHAVIQNVKRNLIRVTPSGTKTSLRLDMTSVPCYFKGGFAPGSPIVVTYQGELKENSPESINLLSITGIDPESLPERDITSTVSGEIIANTSNTITLQTTDGAFVTCRTTGAQNASTGGLLTGSSVKITFNPAVSRQSNIYTCLKIEDA